MPFTERLSEVLYPLDADYADSHDAGTTDGTYVSMQNYHRGWLVLNVGTMQATATLACSIRQATDTSGTSAKAITGKSITQLTQAGGDGDQIICVELRTEELDVQNGFDCVSVRVVVAAAAVEYSYVFYGAVSRFNPTPTTNWTEVVG